MLCPALLNSIVYIQVIEFDLTIMRGLAEFLHAALVLLLPRVEWQMVGRGYLFLTIHRSDPHNRTGFVRDRISTCRLSLFSSSVDSISV